MERLKKPQRPRIEILIPDDEKELAALFRYVSSEDKKTIVENIKKICKDGIGRNLKRLKLPGQNGETLYSLRISRIRVLLTDAESPKGKRVFVIYAPPRHRKDIYLRTGV